MSTYICDEQLHQAIEMLVGHLNAHVEEMDQAFLESDPEGGNTLDISLKITFTAKDKGVNVKTAMSFSKGKITEKDERLTYPRQKSLAGLG
uniref:Uncharacterized protein n=1 Tax=viral metagenome TaxID=1070528 RepID=A0A6H1ZZ79_9ZZZZ